MKKHTKNSETVAELIACGCSKCMCFADAERAHDELTVGSLVVLSGVGSCPVHTVVKVWRTNSTDYLYGILPGDHSARLTRTTLAWLTACPREWLHAARH